MKTKKQVILPAVITVAVFAALLVTATFTDMSVSKLLTSYSLAQGYYHTNQWFSAFFEVLGSVPVCLTISCCLHILFHYGRLNHTGVKRILMTGITAICSAISYDVMVGDIIRYMREIYTMYTTFDHLARGGYIKLVELACGCALAVLGTLAFMNLKQETVNKLFRFAVAGIIIAAIPTILINLVFKAPIGRIRYRAMNVYADDPVYGFAAYSPWYEWKGQWIDKPTMYAMWGNTDVLKSCPSGHTSAAGISYVLIMLNDALGIKNKKIRAINWVLPIVWTGLVATARIVAGAHFFSDVLFGGSLSFITMIIVREIVVCRGSNVKTVLGKKA